MADDEEAVEYCTILDELRAAREAGAGLSVTRLVRMWNDLTGLSIDWHTAVGMLIQREMTFALHPSASAHSWIEIANLAALAAAERRVCDRALFEALEAARKAEEAEEAKSKTFSIRTYFDVTQAVVRVNDVEIGTLSILDLAREDAAASDEEAEEPRAEPEPILIEDDDQPNSELPPRQQTEEGVATQETTRQPEAAVSEADATGVASPRCSGSEGADDRPQRSLQAKPELPPAVEISETAEGGGVPPEPEPMIEAAPEPVVEPAAAPDWLALIDRVEAGESIASVAKSAGVDGRALGGKVTARRRMLKPAGPDAAGRPEPEPAQVEPEEEEADEDEPLALANPEPKDQFWTAQRDLALVVAMVGGRGSYAASQQLGCKPPDCVNRFKQLLPQPGTVAQQELIKRLRALVEAEAGHGA